MNLVPAQSGAVQVTTASYGAWTTIDIPQDITIGQNGTLIVYISNGQHRVVGFDNLNVSYYKGRLLDEQHYYPFGLTMKGASASASPLVNRYLYQGKEMQDEAGLQLYDFHARQYDPQIGRFWGIDPMDQFPSGYTGMGNSPPNEVDPTGMAATVSPWQSGGNDHPGSGANGVAVDWNFGDGDMDDISDKLSAELGGGGGGGGEGQGEDKTEVYSTAGQPIGLLNDSYINQIHFVDLSALGLSVDQATDMINTVNGSSQDNINAAATLLRANSSSFIDKGGAKQLKDIGLASANTGRFGQEVLFNGTVSNTRSINFQTIPSPASATEHDYQIYTGITNYRRMGGSTDSWMSYGHTHSSFWNGDFTGQMPIKKYTLQQALDIYAQPSPRSYTVIGKNIQVVNNDYENALGRLMPLFIASPVGLTLYNSDMREDYITPISYNWFNKNK